MSNDTNSNNLQSSQGKPEAFPVPRTMPENWDLSALSGSDQKNRSRRKPANQAQRAASRAQANRARTQDQAERSSESFPQTRTFPGNWDLSE